MRRSADRVARAEEPVHRSHPVIAPLVVARRAILGTARPRARTRRVRTHDVRLRGRQLGWLLLRVDTLRSPDHRLADRHVEEVLPTDLLLFRRIEHLLRMHVDRALARLDLLDQRVVAEACRHRMQLGVLADARLDLVKACGLIEFTRGIRDLRLQQQEPRPNRTVPVLEARQDDLVLHLRHHCARRYQQAISGSCAPRSVPGPPHALADGPRTINVRTAAGADDDRLRAEHVELAGAHMETNGARDAVRLLAVHQQVRHHDPVVNLGDGLACGLGDDRLVALAVNHDLPLAFAQVAAGLRILDDRQAPLLEHVYRRVDVAGDVVDQVLAHQTHEVAARVAHEVLGLVLVPLHAHVAVDRGEALRDGPATLDVRLLHEDDVEIPAPEARFVRRTAATEAAAYDQDVRIDEASSSRHDVRPPLA